MLAGARRQYERSHGRIVVVSTVRRGAARGLSGRRSISGSDLEAIADAAAEEEETPKNTGEGWRYSEKKMEESFAAQERIATVGQRVATCFGVGLVEAVRVHDSVYQVRLAYGVAFLQVDAFVDIKAVVTTPYGEAEVVAVDCGEDGHSLYQVELGWGYAFMQASAISWSGKIAIEPMEMGDGFHDSDEESDSDVEGVGEDGDTLSLDDAMSVTDHFDVDELMNEEGEELMLDMSGADMSGHDEEQTPNSLEKEGVATAPSSTTKEALLAAFDSEDEDEAKAAEGAPGAHRRPVADDSSPPASPGMPLNVGDDVFGGMGDEVSEGSARGPTTYELSRRGRNLRAVWSMTTNSPSHPTHPAHPAHPAHPTPPHSCP